MPPIESRLLKTQSLVTRPSTFTAHSRLGPQNFGPSTSFTPWGNQSPMFQRPADFSLRPGHCFACGKFGHWRSEGPQRGSTAKGIVSLMTGDKSKRNNVSYNFLVYVYRSMLNTSSVWVNTTEKTLIFGQMTIAMSFLLPSVKGRLIKSVNYW